MADVSKIIDCVFENGYIDEKYVITTSFLKADDVLLHIRHGDVTVCLAERNENFFVRPFYRDDYGIIHLLSQPNGKLVSALGISLEKAIEQYNRIYSYDSLFFSQLVLITREQWRKRHKVI